MRIAPCALMTIVSSLTLAGCRSGAVAHTPPAATADSHGCLLRSAGVVLLRLDPDLGSSCDDFAGGLTIRRENLRVDIWNLRTASSVDEAIPMIAQAIASEFKDFKATSSTEFMVAGAPARQFAGTGLEADDNDAGTADVALFRVRQHVFVACTHGESLSPAARDWMTSLLASVRGPQ